MEYKYKFKSSVILLMFIFPLFALIALPDLIKERKIFFLILDISAISIMLFHGFPYLFSMRNIIDDDGLKEITTYYGYSKVKDLHWHEIGYIVDDYVAPLLGLPIWKLHIFHIMPKDNIRKPFKRISISGGIKNYKDLLFQVVSHVDPEVVIDDYVYKFLDKYKKDLEKQRKQ